MWSKKVRVTWRGKKRSEEPSRIYVFGFGLTFLVWGAPWLVTGCVCLHDEMRAVAEVVSIQHHQKNMANWQIGEIFSNFPLLFFLQIWLIWFFLLELNSGIPFVQQLRQELTSWCSHVESCVMMKGLYLTMPRNQLWKSGSFSISAVSACRQTCIIVCCVSTSVVTLVWFFCSVTYNGYRWLVGRPGPIRYWQHEARFLWHVF